MANLSNLGGNYALGLTNPPDLLEVQGIPDPHPGDLSPFAESFGLTGSQRTLYLGKPVAKWKWGMLEQHQLNLILAYVSAGSQQVYFKTRVPSGVVATYNTFRGMMHYPTQLNSRPGGLWADTEIIFTDLTNA